MEHTQKVYRKTKLRLFLAGLLVLAFVVQAAGHSLAAQLPARFFEEYGTPMLVIEPESGSIRFANQAAAGFYGYDVDELQGMQVQQINALDIEDVEKERALARQEERNYFVFPHRLASGEIRTVEVHSWPLRTDDGETLLFSVIVDITGKKVAQSSVLEYSERLQNLAESRYQKLISTQRQMNYLLWAGMLFQLLVIVLLLWNIFKRRKTERELRKKTTMLEGLLDSIPEIIFFKGRNGRYIGGNARFSDYVGCERQQVAGKTDYDFFSASRAESYRKTDQQVLAEQKVVRVEERVVFPDGTERLLDKVKAPLVDTGGALLGVIGVSHDITERDQYEERIRFLAYYDPLTKLPNRFLFQEQLEALCAELKASQTSNVVYALAIIDLDHFKNINDALGHTKGDELLVALAERLKGMLHDNEVVARFGGDEFVLLLQQEHSQTQQAEQLLEDRIQQLQAALAKPVELGESEFLLSSSLGATFSQECDKGFAVLLKEADIALYAAKEAGRSTWRRFQPCMQVQVEARFALEGELRKAIESQQFRLYLQPKINQTGAVYGVESLVRWEHPEQGLISPGLFIPLAEETGLIVALGEWVLSETLQLMRRFPQLTFAVNISPRQFRHPDFVSGLQQQLEQTGADPSRLTLEVTEGLLITDFNQALHCMKKLQQLGVSFSIDDFGTGYSSLSYLKKLPINELKIDRSFIDGLPHDSSDALLVQTMMSVAKHLELLVVAEGVENKEQRDYLYSVGCTLHQGFFYGKPEPAQMLLARIESQQGSSD